jgi:hypothetical protein
MRRDRLEPGRALAQRRVEQVLTVHMEQVEQERHDALGWRVGVDLRDGVLEGGGSFGAHPQRLAVDHGLPHRQAKDCGDDPGQGGRDLVEVAGVDAHVTIARCIWTRMPSSFHSTDAHSNPENASVRVAPVDASIGRIGRKSSKPTSLSPSSPVLIAISAIRGRSPESISARRASSPATPAACATASAISPARAPCRSSPVNSRLRRFPSSSVARPSNSPSSRRRTPPEPLPVAASISVIARSTSITVSVGAAAGAASVPYTAA